MLNPSRRQATDRHQVHEQQELLRWVAELYYIQEQGQAAPTPGPGA